MVLASYRMEKHRDNIHTLPLFSLAIKICHAVLILVDRVGIGVGLGGEGGGSPPLD